MSDRAAEVLEDLLADLDEADADWKFEAGDLRDRIRVALNQIAPTRREAYDALRDTAPLAWWLVWASPESKRKAREQYLLIQAIQVRGHLVLDGPMLDTPVFVAPTDTAVIEAGDLTYTISVAARG